MVATAFTCCECFARIQRRRNVESLLKKHEEHAILVEKNPEAV
jgi:hypothetical protein